MDAHKMHKEESEKKKGRIHLIKRRSKKSKTIITVAGRCILSGTLRAKYFSMAFFEPSKLDRALYEKKKCSIRWDIMTDS